MAGYVVVGCQWGDEGKGKIVDVLSAHADMIVRFQGGNNAGHTVVVQGEKHILHLLPSGCLHEQASCIIEAGVVVDPFVLLQEIAILEQKGIDSSHILISDRAHIVMPYHVYLDELQEARAPHSKKIGTTKRGIGPCYSDKYLRIGLRLHDLQNFAVFKEKLAYILQHKNEEIVKIYHGKPFDYETILADFEAIRPQLLGRIKETTHLVHEALASNKLVLFEGAQAAMLDINYGSYPYVTSSSPSAAGVCVGACVAPQMLHRIIGVVKAYSTRVGEGPFVSELHDEIGTYLQSKGHEFGATTARARRCGWLDVVVVKHAVQMNGLTDIVLTKLDVLSGLATIKVCVAYELHDQQFTYIPSAIEELAQAKPIYKTMDGWKEDISKITSFADLPTACQHYIRFIEEFTNTNIAMISVGPERSHNIMCYSLL